MFWNNGKNPITGLPIQSTYKGGFKAVGELNTNRRVTEHYYTDGYKNREIRLDKTYGINI
ncbi:MAG: hypothetical protein ABFS35_23545 [Bacteroidota bacterium]